MNVHIVDNRVKVEIDHGSDAIVRTEVVGNAIQITLCCGPYEFLYAVQGVAKALPTFNTSIMGRSPKDVLKDVKIVEVDDRPNAVTPGFKEAGKRTYEFKLTSGCSTERGGYGNVAVFFPLNYFLETVFGHLVKFPTLFPEGSNRVSYAFHFGNMWEKLLEKLNAG